MRVSVAVEGAPTLDGRMIAHQALTFSSEPVPVTSIDTGDIIGSARDFQREAGGLITAEVEVPEYVNGTYAITVAPAEFLTRDDGVQVIHSGRVRSLAAGVKWNWES